MVYNLFKASLNFIVSNFCKDSKQISFNLITFYSQKRFIAQLQNTDDKH